jgi:hypothetical protein
MEAHMDPAEGSPWVYEAFWGVLRVLGRRAWEPGARTEAVAVDRPEPESSRVDGLEEVGSAVEVEVECRSRMWVEEQQLGLSSDAV